MINRGALKHEEEEEGHGKDRNNRHGDLNYDNGDFVSADPQEEEAEGKAD